MARVMERILPFFGLGLWILIAFCFSNHRKRISWRLVLKGLTLQLVLTVAVLGIPALGIGGPLKFLFDWGNTGIVAVLNYSNDGGRFIFGELTNTSKFGFIFAVQVLPTIIFMSTLMAVFYHLGIMQPIVNFFARLMQKTLGTSGAETLSTAANIFVGQTEAPIIVKPFLQRMTQSELFCVMVGGMASVAGGVLAAYVGILNDKIPGIAGHLLIASILSAPASIVISKIIIPETEFPETSGKIPSDSLQKVHTNTIDAAASGAAEGLGLALNVAAMVLAFIALVALMNGILGSFGGLFGMSLSFQMILGWIFAPFSFFLGIPWDEALRAGSLLGEKTVLNEFVAYLSLSEQSDHFSERSRVILSYALCGFANFASIAIQIGGIGSMAPSRKKDLAKMGLRSVLGGTLCSFLIASMVAVLI